MASESSERHPLISRRDAILRVGAMLGSVALVGQTAMLAGCEKQERNSAGADADLFAQSDIELLGEIAETILPETSTPGAKAAGVGPFMALMVVDCYDEREQETFVDGLAQVDERCRDMHDTSFMAATPAQRTALLEVLDGEQMQHMRARAKGKGGRVHYFRMMKELTLLGYFTSEIGYTQAMRYAETPGRFDPCVPYAPGDKIWASHA